jgi:hypothetical protein
MQVCNRCANLTRLLLWMCLLDEIKPCDCYLMLDAALPEDWLSSIFIVSRIIGESHQGNFMHTEHEHDTKRMTKIFFIRRRAVICGHPAVKGRQGPECCSESSESSSVVSHYLFQMAPKTKCDRARFTLKEIYSHPPAPGIRTTSQIWPVLFASFGIHRNLLGMDEWEMVWRSWSLSRVQESFTWSGRSDGVKWL